MATLISVRIVPSESIIYLGDQVQYQALAEYDTGLMEDVTSEAVWELSGSPTIIAEFSEDEDGLLSSLATGEETVYATYGGMLDSISLTIHNPLLMPLPLERAGLYRPSTQDYLDLFTSQYQNSPKLLHWARTFLDIVEDIRELAEVLPLYFSFNRVISPESAESMTEPGYLTVKSDDFEFVSFEACVGEQLDMLGEVIGRSRRVSFSLTDGSGSYLSDDSYRVLLKNQVIVNHWNGMSDTLSAFWKQAFPTGKIVIQDNQDMSLDIYLSGTFSSQILDLIVNGYIVPRPQGVDINYFYGDTPFFGFDRQDDIIAGFDTGYWV
jgi:hypothetical protein